MLARDKSPLNVLQLCRFEVTFIFEPFYPGHPRVLFECSGEIKRSSLMPPASQGAPLWDGAGCKVKPAPVPRGVTLTALHPGAMHFNRLLLALAPPCKQQQQSILLPPWCWVAALPWRGMQ